MKGKQSSPGSNNLYDIYHTLNLQNSKNEVLKNYNTFRQVLLEYIELMKVTLFNGYDFEIPGFGTFQIVKRQNFKMHKYHIIISRIGYEYLILFSSEKHGSDITFSACREFRVQLRDLLMTSTKDFKQYAKS